MSDFEGKSIETASCWAPLSSPSPMTILAMLNQTNNGQNSMTGIVSRFNVPKDPSKQRSAGRGEGLASRRKILLPTLDTENISSFATFYRNPSPNILISTGYSPSILLQSPNMMFPSSEIPMSLVTNNKPQTVVDSGESHVDLSLQQVVENDDGNIFSTMQEENNNEKEDNDKGEDQDIVHVEEHEDKDHDNLDIDLSLKIPKRKHELLSSMIGATRRSKQPRVIIQMESQEDNHDDGFRWRKYGQKIVKGNPNPRSYYKCTYNQCKVKKHVERGAADVKLVVITYDGTHDHHTPDPRFSGPKNRNSSSQGNIDRTSSQLGRPPFTFSSRVDTKPPITWLGPQINMTKLFMTGLSKLPSLTDNQNSGDQSVNQNLGFMYQNDHSVNHNSDFTHQDDRMAYQNWNYQPVSHDAGFMSCNDQPIHQLANQNLRFISQNDPPVNQHYDFMFQNNQSANQNLGLTYKNDQPKIDATSNDTNKFKGIMQRLSDHGVRFK